MKEQFDVFISYRRSNGGTELANVVRNYLTSRGLRVFLDTRELIDGQYFDTQLRERLIETPNYVLIATPEAFQFRKGEDWVREEIKLAVSEFKKNPQNRSIIPFVPNGTVFPESGLPEGLENLPRFNRILLKDTKPTGAELLRLAKAICRVNRRNMWNAGQRVLERSKAEGSRFHLLHVDERIMPLYKKDKRAKAQGATLPINVTSGESKEESSLRDALQAQQGSLYLIGEGGIGKTTAMISIMERHYTDQSYSDSGEIPIFVELNGAPKSARWYQGEDGLASDFIRREIARLFLGVNSIGKVPKDYISGMDTLFTKETESPEYLLLLDGLNEVSTDYVSDENGYSQPIRSLIIEEINYLLTECPNVRVMLTSRTDETEINCSEHGIEKLYLTGLHKDSITEYLKSKKFSSREIKDALADERLFDCIRIPLFLTMFAALNKTKGVSSRGEIFSRFFHERSDELQSEYTQKNRLDSLKKDTVNKGQLRFILDFLLPAIGCEMERRNDFKMTAEEAAKIILPILEGRDTNGNKPEKTAHPCAVIGEYGKQCFSGYKGSASLPKIASLLLSVSDDISEVAEYILTSAMDILGILYRNDEAEYGFIHHHFRDYFAGVYDINLLRIALQAYAKHKPDLAFESLASFIANANHREKSIFIGEILGEHHNKPILKGKTWQYNVPTSPEDRNLLKRALDIFRGRFGEEVGYGVYNLIEVLKLVRENLSGAKLSKLDFAHINLNGYVFDECNMRTFFDGAKIGHNTLFPVGHSNWINFAAFSLDGTRIVTASDDGTSKVWDTATGTLLHDLKGHNRSVHSASFNHDGTRIVTASRDATAKVWDATTGTLLHDLKGHNRSVHSASFNHDGTRIVTASEDGTSKVWDTATGTLLHDLKGDNRSVHSASFNHDGTRIVTASDDGTSKVWDTATGTLLHDLKGHSDMVFSAAFNRDGKRIITASRDETAKVWDATTGTLLHDLKGHIGSVISAAFNCDGTRIVTASADDSAKVWDAETGTLLHDLEGHIDLVSSAVFSLDGTRIVTASRDATAKVWDATTGTLLHDLKGHNRSVHSASFNHDGTRIVTTSDECSAKVWDTATGTLLHDLKGYSRSIKTVAFNHDGTRIVTVSYDGTAMVWNTETGTLLHDLKCHRWLVGSVTFSRDITRIVTTSGNNTAKVWDAATGILLHELNGHNDEVTYAAFNRDGKRIVTASEDGSAKVWDAVSGALLHDLSGHSDDVTYAAFDRDGAWIVTASYDGSAKVWDAVSGTLLHDLYGHSRSIKTVAFNRDGTRIVTASNDSTAKVWDTETGTLLHDLEGDKRSLEFAEFNRDGTRIVTVSAYGTIKVWDATTGIMLHDLKENSDSDYSASHNLTKFEMLFLESIDKVYSASLNHDGSRVVTAWFDGTAKVWDVETGTLLHDLMGHSDSVRYASFICDGTRIITVSNDGTAKLWDMETGECLDTIPIISGLMIMGVDLRNLHADSNLSDGDKDILRRYGAIVD